MLKLLRLLRQELSTTRAVLPLIFGCLWCTRPLLNPETGWQPLPDLLYEGATLALVVDICLRVRRAWRADAPQ